MWQQQNFVVILLITCNWLIKGISFVIILKERSGISLAICYALDFDKH